MSVLSRKERDKLLRKADILRASEHIFALRGYDKATMQDIAKRAQYATGTVYLYFKDKSALYCSLLEEKMRYLLSTIKDKIASAKDSREKLGIFLEEELDFFKVNKDFFRILVSENNGARFIIGFRISNSCVFREYSEYVSELIKITQQQGLIRNDLYPNQIIDIFRSIFASVIIDWFKKEPQEYRDSKEMSCFILDMLLNGIGQKHSD